MATNTSKPLTKRIIFLLAAAILYLMIPQNATMPMPEEAVFPFSLLSLSQIARVFAFRQWIAMDLILFTAVLVIMQLIRGKHEGGMFLRNKTARNHLHGSILSSISSTCIHNDTNRIHSGQTSLYEHGCLGIHVR